MESGQDGLVDLACCPAGYDRSAVQQHFHQADHARVVDLDAGYLAVPTVMGSASRCRSGKSTCTFSHSAWKAAKRPVTASSFSRTAARWSRPFFRPKSDKLLEQASLRR